MILFNKKIGRYSICLEFSILYCSYIIARHQLYWLHIQERGGKNHACEGSLEIRFSLARDQCNVRIKVATANTTLIIITEKMLARTTGTGQ